MRHRKSGVKLNMTTSHRDAMFRNMATSLFKYGRIKTTDVRARELRRWADHLITLAKRGDLHALRQVMSVLREKDVVHKLFKEAGQRYAETTSGYTRLTKLGPRKGDAADLSLVELTGQPLAEEDTKPTKEKKAKKAGSGKEKKDKTVKKALQKKAEKSAEAITE
jgi:large subunit ribosomal protein L17